MDTFSTTTTLHLVPTAVVSVWFW